MDMASYDVQLIFTAGANMELPDCISRFRLATMNDELVRNGQRSPLKMKRKLLRG